MESTVLKGVSSSWYLVQCKPHEDQRAVENLQNQGFESFAPRCVVERLRKRRLVKCVEALFPGYAFVGLNKVDHDWGKVRSTRGVNRLVRFGLYAPTLPIEIIASLRAVDGLELVPKVASLRAGDRVRILDGPFADLEAIFEKHDGNERVHVLIELMHRSVSVLFPARMLVAV